MHYFAMVVEKVKVNQQMRILVKYKYLKIVLKYSTCHLSTELQHYSMCSVNAIN